MNNCIGLFGTCGTSTFRQDLFIPRYNELGMVEGDDFYNPQLPPGMWDPSNAKIEAEHLANDKIILFPVTSESYGLGSLSEIGFSLLNAIKLEEQRYFVTMIDNQLDDKLMEDENLARESLKSRALVREHLKNLKFKNLFVVENLNDMLELSIQLYDISSRLDRFEQNYHIG